MLDRSLIDRKIHDSVMEACFESIVTRAFIGAVPIERSQLSAGLTQGLEGYVSDCLKDLGGVRLLQKAIESEQDPNRKLYLSRIWEVCNESANSVVDRVVEENKDDEALKDAAEKVAMTDEEVAKFTKKSDNLVPDELVRIIQQKTLDTIKEEKAAYQKDAELEAEISNALNVADEDDESSEPDSPGDEDGNPVGGSDEGAPKAMTQQENGAKSGEQIGTDASESWGAATESDTSTGDTGHFNDVNNDKALNVCKIDSRENITSEADEIMKDKIMVDAEKQNDTEAKEEVGEGGKVFESWSEFLDAYETEAEVAQEGIIKAMIHGRGAKKVTQAQLDVIKDVPLLKLLPLYDYSIEFDGLKYSLDSSCDEFERGIKMMQAIGVKCHIESKEPYGVAFVDETYTIPNDPAILAMFGFDAEYQYGIFAEAGDRIEAGRLWIATKRGRKYDGMLLTTQEEIRQTAAYLIDLSKRGKLKKPLPKIEGFEIAYESATAVNDEGFETEPDPKEDTPPQTGCTHAFIKDQNTATKEDQECSPTGEQIGQECPCEEKTSPKVDNPKAMEAYMHMIAGPNPRPKHATVFSKIQELAYEGICATREQYSGIPFETMAAITKENTFPAFESNFNRGPRQRIDNVARYAFESLATPDEPMDQQENLETSLLTASVIYTFFETLSTMNLYSPKLAEIRKFVDETLPLEQKTLGDKRLLEDAIRSVVSDIKSKGAHARTVPEVDEARSDLQIVRERVGMPGFESVRSKAEAMIKDAQESIDARNDRIVASMRPVQAAVESSTALMLRTRDTLKFDRVANLMGRKPNVMTVKAKIDPQAKSKYVAIECYTADNKPAGTSTVVLEGATESLVDYVTSAVKGSKLMGLDKHIVVSDSRNAKIYLDNAN